MVRVSFPIDLHLVSGAQAYYCLYKVFALSPVFYSYSNAYERVRFNCIQLRFSVFWTLDDSGTIKVSYLNKLPENPDSNVYPYVYSCNKYKVNDFSYVYNYDEIDRSIWYDFSDLVKLQEYEFGVPEGPFYSLGKWPNFTIESDVNLVITCNVTFDIDTRIITNGGVRFKDLVLDGTASPEDVVYPATFYSNDSNNKMMGRLQKYQDVYEAPPGTSEYNIRQNGYLTKLVVHAANVNTDVPLENPIENTDQVPEGQEYVDTGYDGMPEGKKKTGTLPTLLNLWKKIVGDRAPDGSIVTEDKVYNFIQQHIVSNPDTPGGSEFLKQCLNVVRQKVNGPNQVGDIGKIIGEIKKIVPVLQSAKREFTYTKNGEYTIQAGINQLFKQIKVTVKTESFPWKFDRARGKFVDLPGGEPIIGTPFLFAGSIKLLWTQKVINVMPGASVMFAVRPEGHKRIRITISNKIETEIEASIVHPTAVMWITMPGSGETDKPSAVEIGNKESFGEENSILNPEKGMMFLIPSVLTAYDVYLSRDMFEVEGLGWG